MVSAGKCISIFSRQKKLHEPAPIDLRRLCDRLLLKSLTSLTKIILPLGIDFLLHVQPVWLALYTAMRLVGTMSKNSTRNGNQLHDFEYQFVALIHISYRCRAPRSV